MTRAIAMILTVALGVASPTPAWAYLKFGVQIGTTVRDVRWTTPIRYFVTERDIAGVTAPQFRDAIARAFGTWQAAPADVPAVEFQGATIGTPGMFDGRSTIGFLDRPDLERVLGATSFMLDATTGAILESDIFFNTRFDWSTASGGQPGRVDLESVATHEIGHLLGLGHSAIGETELQPGGGRRVLGSGAVMFPIAMVPGSIADRVLQPDDIAGIADIYPEGGEAAGARASSINGRITKNGAPLFGAHIVAYNLETGTLIGGFSLGANGEFVIAGLEPGPHLLRVEPLDDADTSSFFVGPIDVDFRVTFAPKVAVAPREGTSEAVVVEVRSR